MKKNIVQTDEQLVKQFMSGDNEAFDVLLNRYQDKLYSYILFIVKNNDVADDLFQETFVKAIVNIRQGRYTHNGTFYNWLMRIAHNLLIDQFRTEKSEGLVYQEELLKEWIDLTNVESTFRENEIANEQVLMDVRRLMEHLPENQREVIYLRFYQNLSFKEIADHTGVSINTSLGRMRYAIMNLRRMAEEHHISLQFA